MNRKLFFVLSPIFFFALFLQTAGVYPEDNQAVDNNPSADETGTPKEAGPEGEKSDNSQETPSETTANKEEKTAERPVYLTNPAMQKQVNEQYSSTPEDPSFLYETRFIPGVKTKEEFLPVELEKEVIKERIQEEKNFRKSLEKIQIRLPDLKQTLILVGLIIIILVYRTRAKRHRSK